MNSVTQCPTCSTKFKVLPQQLLASQGWVRCGRCDNVFDATSHFVDLDEQGADGQGEPASAEAAGVADQAPPTGAAHAPQADEAQELTLQAQQILEDLAAALDAETHSPRESFDGDDVLSDGTERPSRRWLKELSETFTPAGPDKAGAPASPPQDPPQDLPPKDLPRDSQTQTPPLRAVATPPPPPSPIESPAEQVAETVQRTIDIGQAEGEAEDDAASSANAAVIQATLAAAAAAASTFEQEVERWQALQQGKAQASEPPQKAEGSGEQSGEVASAATPVPPGLASAAPAPAGPPVHPVRALLSGQPGAEPAAEDPSLPPGAIVLAPAVLEAPPAPASPTPALAAPGPVPLRKKSAERSAAALPAEKAPGVPGVDQVDKTDKVDRAKTAPAGKASVAPAVIATPASEEKGDRGRQAGQKSLKQPGKRLEKKTPSSSAGRATDPTASKIAKPPGPASAERAEKKPASPAKQPQPPQPPPQEQEAPEFALTDLDQPLPEDADEALREQYRAAFSQTQELNFVRQAERAAFWRSPVVRAAMMASAVLLTAGLALQYAVQHRAELAASSPAMKARMQRLCGVLGCTIEPLRNLDALVIEGSTFQVEGAGVFTLSWSVRNRSTRWVRTPQLMLSLRDDAGQTLLRRALAPDQIKDAPVEIAPGAQWQAQQSLRLSAHAEAVTGYQLQIFYDSTP